MVTHSTESRCTMSKNDKFKHVYVYDVQLCLEDDDGNTLKNEDGTDKLFTPNDKYDCSQIAEWFHPEDLWEITDERTQFRAFKEVSDG